MLVNWIIHYLRINVWIQFVSHFSIQLLYAINHKLKSIFCFILSQFIFFCKNFVKNTWSIRLICRSWTSVCPCCWFLRSLCLKIDQFLCAGMIYVMFSGRGEQALIFGCNSVMKYEYLEFVNLISCLKCVWLEFE